jgi:hypothetical protein
MPKEMVKKLRRHKGMIDNDRSKAPIPQHSTENTDKPKIQVLEEYYNYDSMRLVPITNATLERLMDNGRKWARDVKDAIKLKQWTDLNGIPWCTWQEWVKKYPIAAQGAQDILIILGNKRELGLVERKYEPGSIIFMMPHYDDDWGNMCKWRASLKPKEGEQKSGETFIVIEKYPESDLVPEKKDE